MDIECKIKREGGSNVELFGKTYKFRPDSIGRHVCNVEEKKAIQKLLAIPGTYRLVADDDDNSMTAEILGDDNPPAPSEGLQPSLDGDIVIDDDELENYEEGEEGEGDPEGDEGEEGDDDPANDLAPTKETSTGDTSDDESSDLDPNAVKQEWEATFNKKSGNRTVERMLKDLRAADQE